MQDFIKQDGVTYIRLAALYDTVEQPLLMIPFNSEMEPCVVKRLSHAEIKACGDFSLIETLENKEAQKRKPTVTQMTAYAETQYKLVKASLVSPTYEEIESVCGVKNIMANADTELKELQEQIFKMPNGPKKSKLQTQFDTVKMQSRFILPVDFVSAVMSYALRIDDTDIKKISEEMLIDAAILATKGHDNPCDHIHGNFTDFNQEDINTRAWILDARRAKEHSKNGKLGRRG